jgi:hypothetical protein
MTLRFSPYKKGLKFGFGKVIFEKLTAKEIFH